MCIQVSSIDFLCSFSVNKQEMFFSLPSPMGYLGKYTENIIRGDRAISRKGSDVLGVALDLEICFR